MSPVPFEVAAVIGGTLVGAISAMAVYIVKMHADQRADMNAAIKAMSAQADVNEKATEALTAAKGTRR